MNNLHFISEEYGYRYFYIELPLEEVRARYTAWMDKNRDFKGIINTKSMFPEATQIESTSAKPTVHLHEMDDSFCR